MQDNLTSVDFGVIAILMISGVIAWHRGFLKETLSVSSWLIAALSAVFVWPVTKPFTRAIIEQQMIADVLALVGVFFILLIPISFVSFRLTEMVKGSRAGPLDKSLGFVFGVARGLVVVGLGYVIFASFAGPEKQPQWLKEARLLPVIKGTADVIRSLSGKPATHKGEQDGEISKESPPEQQEAAKSSGATAEGADVEQTASGSEPEADADSKKGGGKKSGYDVRARRALDQLVSTTSKPE